jgi:5-methyltetrahydrofolate--homocysteine methyltransferase
MLQDIVANKKITANGVVGIFPCRSNNTDDIVLEEGTVFNTIRQQEVRDGPYFALSDFISPDYTDYIGCFAVTAGLGV